MSENQTLATVRPKADWYNRLILDLKKMEFTGIIVTKWNIGKRILEDELKFEKPTYGSKTIVGLASDLKVSKTDLYDCICFAREYELSDISENFKGLSWYHITHELLPEHGEASLKEQLDEIDRKTISEVCGGFSETRLQLHRVLAHAKRDLEETSDISTVKQIRDGLLKLSQIWAKRLFYAEARIGELLAEAV